MAAEKLVAIVTADSRYAGEILKELLKRFPNGKRWSEVSDVRRSTDHILLFEIDASDGVAFLEYYRGMDFYRGELQILRKISALSNIGA